MGLTFTIFGGQLKLHNVLPRPTEDPLWLATNIPALPKGAHVLDAGCGSGAAGLALLKRQPHLKLSALDIDPALTELAQINAELNHLRITTHTINILTNPHLGPFDAIICNPPFHKQIRGHATPNEAKSRAHTLRADHFPLWLTALTHMLKSQGHLYMIVHSACEDDLRTFAPANGFSLHLTPLQTHPERAPKRLLAHLETSALPQITVTPALPAYNATLRQHHLGEKP